MVSGVIDASFQMTAFVVEGGVEFCIHFRTGTAYYCEKDLEALVQHLKIVANKGKELEA